MSNKSILQVTKDTRQRFIKFREEYGDNPECNDDELINELLDYAIKKLEEE